MATHSNLRPSVAAATEHILRQLQKQPGEFVVLDALTLALDTGLPAAVFVEAIDALSEAGSIQVRIGPRLCARTAPA